MKNGFRKYLAILHHRFLTNMIPLSFPTKCSPHSFFCPNYMKKLTLVSNSHYMKYQTTLFSLPFIYLLYTTLSQTHIVFLIQHIPEDTLKPRWFLVQINYVETNQLDIDSKTAHLDDCRLRDNTSRWWPLWHEYKFDNKNVYVYGIRILLDRKFKPDLKNSFLLTDSVYLIESSYCLHGPFDFDLCSDIIVTKEYIVLSDWGHLLTACNALGIVPPIIFTPTDVKVSNRRK